MQHTLIARLMEPTWGPSGADRTQAGPMLAPRTLLSGYEMTVKLTRDLYVGPVNIFLIFHAVIYWPPQYKISGVKSVQSIGRSGVVRRLPSIELYWFDQSIGHHIAVPVMTARWHVLLTHWGRDKMAAISQTALSNAFSWMKMLELRLKFDWSLFLRVQLTIFQRLFT